MKTDVIIIGGGIVGCATAYYLVKKGMQVLVLEKNSAVGVEASGRNGGGVRQHGRKAALPLAMASVRLWTTLAEELNSDLEYIQTGNINIAVDDASIEVFEQEIAWEHAHGLTEVRMLTAEECHALVPGATNQVLAGKYCQTDGVANPMLVTPAFARAGRRLGVKIKTNETVKCLLLQGSRVCGVKTEVEEFEAGIVINTAGPWASRFSEQVGCPMPISPGRSHILITERVPKDMVTLWVNVRGRGYMRPTVSGNLALGSGGARNDNYSQQVEHDKVATQAERWGRYFPWLREISIIRTFSGITEYTPDGEPYIGAVPCVEGLFVAAAFHGEGFCPGPMVGRILSELVTGGQSKISLDPFRPDRFAKYVKEGNLLPPVVFPWDKMLS
jgi:sarcosine oxidase subunit beta